MTKIGCRADNKKTNLFKDWLIENLLDVLTNFTKLCAISHKANLMFFFK